MEDTSLSVNTNLNVDTIPETMEDFNIPSAERVALLEQLQEAVGDVPPHFWAACQICDLDALKILVKCGREYPKVLRSFTLQTYTMAHYWGPSPLKAQSQPSTPQNPMPLKGPSSTPPAKRQKTSDSPATRRRNQQVRDLAEERDKSCCVLTGDGSIQVAHIYPFHSMKYQEQDLFGQRHIFWDHLRNFWPEEKITAWEAELFPAGISEFSVERVYNLVTLSPTVHDKWGRGAFALKPISESNDKKTLEVQFFWQKKQQETQAAISLLTTPFSTKDLSQNEGALRVSLELFDFRSKAIIRSGDSFTLQTDDPETKPLPSFTLLELQWFLQRIQGMAGAADIDWPPYSDSGSDYSNEEEVEEIPDLILDEVEDSSLLSSQPLSSPTKLVCNDNSNLPIHPKHQEAKGEGEGEGAEQGRQVAM